MQKKPEDSKVHMPAEHLPGQPVELCTDAPSVRYRDPQQKHQPTPSAEGYTSRGHVQHFLPDREVNLAKLNKALADVYGEPALRMLKMHLEIDRTCWEQTCSDPWSGNVYRYNFSVAEFERKNLVNQSSDGGLPGGTGYGRRE